MRSLVFQRPCEATAVGVKNGIHSRCGRDVFLSNQRFVEIKQNMQHIATGEKCKSYATRLIRYEHSKRLSTCDKSEWKARI